jgi:hypothetical protein
LFRKGLSCVLQYIGHVLYASFPKIPRRFVESHLKSIERAREIERDGFYIDVSAVVSRYISIIGST